MLPLILVSNSEKEIKRFIDDYSKENNFSKDRTTEISPLKKEIVISQIREIRKKIGISSALPRLFVLYNFDRATLEAQNAFLKSLEDGALKNQFILNVGNEHLLLNTVRSRSTVIRLQNKKVPDKSEEKQSTLLKKIESTAGYSFITEAALKNSTPEETVKLIEIIVKYYRNKLAVKPNASEIIKKSLSF